MLDAEPALPSVLQRIWDQHRHRMPLHLILCGSALGTLERLGDVTQPLHGRFDLELKLRAFDYADAAGFVPGWPRGDQLRLYGVFGGLARHLAEVEPARSLADNVQRAILAPHAPLHDAAPELLRSERLSSRAEAVAVLSAVAAGESTFGAIAARAGISGNRADYVIKELLELEILERVVRWGDREGSRYTRYRCADPFTRFWFRFVGPNRSALNSADPARVWTERVARQAALAGVLGPQLGSIAEAAPWWSRDGRTEIDLILRAGREVLAVECRWRGSGEVDLRALRQLRDHVSRQPTLGGDPNVRLCLVSAGGFAPALRQVAEAEGVLLIGPEVLLPAIQASC
jgi:AAA+ ATPase superfamily predicted ATPase